MYANLMNFGLACLTFHVYHLPFEVLDKINKLFPYVYSVHNTACAYVFSSSHLASVVAVLLIFGISQEIEFRQNVTFIKIITFSRTTCL